MANLYIVTIKFIPIIALILLGVFIRKIKLLRPETIQDLKAIIINISLPSMLILTFSKTVLELRYVYIILAVFLTCVIMLIMGSGFSKKLCPGNRYYPVVFGSYETGMLGFALFTAFFGAENTYKLAIVDIGQEFFAFFVMLNFLNRQNGGSASVKQMLSGFIKSPLVIAILTGIVLGNTGLTTYLANFQITDSFVSVLTLLGNLTVPLICIIIGYEFSLDIKGIGRPFITALLRMALMFGFALLINEFLLVRLLKLDSGFGTALFTMFLLPPSFVIPIFIDQKAIKEKRDVLNVISVHIVLTLIAFLILVTVRG